MQQEQKTFKLEIPEQAANIIVEALGELPAKKSMNVIALIQQQVQAQLNAPKAAEAKQTKAPSKPKAKKI